MISNLEFSTITSKANSVDNQSLESIKDLGGKVDKIETEIKTLVQRADSTAFVGERPKVQFKMKCPISNKMYLIKQTVLNKKYPSVSDTLKKQDESTIEFHKKSEKLFDGLQEIKNSRKQVIR